MAVFPNNKGVRGTLGLLKDKLAATFVSPSTIFLMKWSNIQYLATRLCQVTPFGNHRVVFIKLRLIATFFSFFVLIILYLPPSAKILFFCSNEKRSGEKNVGQFPLTYQSFKRSLNRMRWHLGPKINILREDKERKKNNTQMTLS